MKNRHADRRERNYLCMLLFFLCISPLVAEEKQTSYRFENIDFSSLNAAEEYMRHHSYYAGLPAPSANWLQFLNRQEVPPGSGNAYLEFGFRDTDYSEVPGIVAYMTTNTSVDCDVSCPIMDGFGNDFCTANIWPFCLSDGPIINKMLELESRPLCPAEVNAWPSYEPVLDNLGGFQVTWQFSNQNLIQAAGFAQYKGDLAYTSYFSGCEYPQSQVQSIYPHTSVYCPVGYNHLIRTSAGYKCINPLIARIYETGAVTPEPTMACSIGNPCHPATGNKSLVENDFSSPTLSFTRSYHSMTHYNDFAGLGRGWTHNYAQRILDYPGSAVSARKLIDGKGNVEYFECADSPVCSVYRSVSEAGRVLMPIGGGWLYRAPNGEQRTFDAEGKLESIEMMNGNYTFLTILYNADGKVDTVSDQFGRRLSLHYNQDGLIELVELPSGDSITFAHVDPNPPAGFAVERQNLVRVVREDQTERTYHYEDRNPDATPRNVFLLTGITDELGVRFATYAYDEHARVILSEHANGADRVTMNYTHRPGEPFNWSVTEATGPLGEVITYDMDAGPFRKIRSIADSRGMLTMSYDASSTWRSVKTDREFNQTRYQYDVLHETRRTEAAGAADERVIETIWNDELNRVSELREPGKNSYYEYNARGQVVNRTEVDTVTLARRSWSYTYFETPSPAPLIGQIKSIDGPRTDVSDITNYEYYTNDDVNGRYLSGDLKAVVNALGHRTDYLQYDANGRPLQTRDANGVLTVLDYHARGWLTSRTTDGRTIYFSYDAAGNLTRIMQPDGSYTQYEYDDAHRMIAIEDRMGNRIDYLLDADGNRTVEKTYDDRRDLRRQLSRVYDELSRLRVLLDGNSDATAFAYDDNGNLTESTDPNSIVRAFEYDSLNRLVKIIDNGQSETVLDYDARDNLQGVTDPLGNVTRYTHDGLDNRIRVDSPDTGATSFEYDAAGNRTAVTDARGVRTKYAYDALNRLGEIMYPDSTLDVSFTYDLNDNGKGRLSRMTDAGGTKDYTYDARGNLVREAHTIGTAQYVTEYGYNAADRLQRISYPSGMVIDHTLDNDGRIQALEQTRDDTREILVSDVQYEPFGPAKSFRYGNGTIYNAQFNLDYELLQLQAGNELDWLFGRDPAGNILSIDDLKIIQYDQVFAYDEFHRLRAAMGDYGSEIFDYDVNGNRKHYLSNLIDEGYTYEPGSSRLVLQNDWVISRDAGGNRRAKSDSAGLGTYYDYADNSRLVKMGQRDTGGDTLVAEYVYDGRGQRVGKIANGVATHFVYGLAGELLGEYDSNGSPLAEYIYLNGQPVAVFARQTNTLPSTPAEIIIDNEDPGTDSAGSWGRKKSKQNYGDDYLLGNKADTYRWTPASISGIFEVYAWWVSGKKNSGVATYTISHAGLNDAVVVGHDKNGGEWHLLGTFEFTGYRSENVELRSGDGKNISADAMRFVQVDGGDGETVTSEGTYFIHTDHLGTPRQVSNDLQAVVWRWDSRPFGNSEPDEDPDGDGSSFELNLRFPGQYYDRESRHHYNYFRTYDPSTGRYLESDPIGLGGGLNTFTYVNANSLRYVDPFGLDTEFCKRWFYRVPVPYARHCFVRYSDGSSSSFGPGGPGPDPAPDWWPKECQATEGDQDDGCMKREMGRCEAEQYDFVGFNCCHCVERAMNACGIGIPREDWPNWPVNPGLQPGELVFERVTGQLSGVPEP